MGRRGRRAGRVPRRARRRADARRERTTCPESHRHLSNLIGIYPFNLITIEGGERDRPDHRRLAGAVGPTGHAGLVRLQLLLDGCLRARVGDAEAALRYLDIFVQGVHPAQRVPRQRRPDARRLLQASPTGRSRWRATSWPPRRCRRCCCRAGARRPGVRDTEVIRIFPAMPWRWHEASFQDLRAEGGYRVSRPNARTTPRPGSASSPRAAAWCASATTSAAGLRSGAERRRASGRQLPGPIGGRPGDRGCFHPGGAEVKDSASPLRRSAGNADRTRRVRILLPSIFLPSDDSRLHFAADRDGAFVPILGRRLQSGRAILAEKVLVQVSPGAFAARLRFGHSVQRRCGREKVRWDESCIVLGRMEPCCWGRWRLLGLRLRSSKTWPPHSATRPTRPSPGPTGGG